MSVFAKRHYTTFHLGELYMSWNYRVIAVDNADFDEEYFEIYEVYYNDNGDEIVSISESSMAPFGDSLAELQEDFSKMELAFNKPLLIMSEIKLVPRQVDGEVDE